MEVQMENAADEIKRLQGCINDLISIMALPAIWSGRESSEKIKTLLDVLVGMLRLDFAYARLNDSIDGSPVELVRLTGRQNPNIQLWEVGRALDRWLTGDAGGPPAVVPNPVGEGQVSIASFRLGLQYEMGVFVAGSQRGDFPTNIEMLLLRVAANQTALGIQEAQRLNEQKRTAEELEQRVTERTIQLTSVNEELRVEISERERAEQEQQKLASLVENSTDFIGFASLEGEALFINRAGRKMVGIDEDEPLRTGILDYIAEQDRKRVQQEILPTVEREGQWEGETQFRNFKTGAATPMLNHLFFIKEPRSNRRLALATISRDITERKRAEKALNKAQAELAHITRVTTLGELTSSIAHEVNQPLAAIVTNGQACMRLLSRDTPGIEGALECIEATISDAMRASEVIKRIRALLKKTVPEKAPLNINDTIQEVIALAASELAKNRVAARTELEADLPPVIGDRVQLQQVMLNLILNANEAMSCADWQPRELFIRSQKMQPDQVIVAVRDSGTGFDPQAAERIFDAFFTTKTHDGGLGLGLSISRTIIESHGGKLWATSNEGKGATFQFTLSTSGAH
jgi:PAS domain S-box-containing protein